MVIIFHSMRYFMSKKGCFSLTVITGFIFGIFDWYFPTIFHISRLPTYINIIVIYSVWFIPACIVSFIALRRTKNIRFVASLVSLSWTVSILVYYGYYIFLLAVPGLPQLDSLQISNAHKSRFLGDWLFILQTTLLPQLGKWLPAAVLGGYVVGYVISKFYVLLSHYCHKS